MHDGSVGLRSPLVQHQPPPFRRTPATPRLTATTAAAGDGKGDRAAAEIGAARKGHARAVLAF